MKTFGIRDAVSSGETMAPPAWWRSGRKSRGRGCPPLCGPGPPATASGGAPAGPTRHPGARPGRGSRLLPHRAAPRPASQAAVGAPEGLLSPRGAAGCAPGKVPGRCVPSALVAPEPAPGRESPRWVGRGGSPGQAVPRPPRLHLERSLGSPAVPARPPRALQPAPPTPRARPPTPRPRVGSVTLFYTMGCGVGGARCRSSRRRARRRGDPRPGPHLRPRRRCPRCRSRWRRPRPGRAC